MSERAAILWFTMQLGLVVCAIQAVIYSLVPTMTNSLLFVAPEALGMLAVLVAVRRGWLVLPATLLVVGLTGLVTAFVFGGGGLEMGFPAVLGMMAVLGALTLGPRAGALLTGWAVACTAAVWAVGSSDVLLLPGQDHRAIRFTVQVLAVLVSGGLVTYAVHRLSLALHAERAQTMLAGRTAASLEKARTFTDAIVQSMAEAVLVTRPDGAVLRANDAALALFGREALVGVSLGDLLDPADLQRLEADPTPGVTARAEGAVRAGFAAPVPVRISRSPVLGEDGALLHVLVISDVSPLVEAQRRSEAAARAAEQANRAKSQFLANMSHELRTPLNAVIGYADMLLDDLDEPGHVADLERIRQSGQHLLGLINDLLDMSKIEAGRMDLYVEPVNLAELLREVRESVALEGSRRGTTVAVELGELTALYTDGRKLRQIVLNLSSNAVKFTEKGTVVLRAAVEGERVRVDVVDTGIGIGPDALQRLFQPFVQADDSTSRRYGGTGLGLVLSRRFAEMMGGTLTAVSTPGQGSTFTLSVPIRLTPATPTPMAEVDPGDAPLVLCVDDDPAMLELLARVLRREGLRVAQAGNGSQALTLAREHRPAVITLDVMMPEMDGWAMLQRLRQDTALCDVPVVMVSMVDHDHGSALALGAADYLAKPVDPDVLTRTLRRYMRTRTGRILVVDDEPDVRELLRRALTAEGWTVGVAENGRVALDRLPEEKPDVVVLDLMTPELDGFGFIEAARADDRWRDLPIVVLTAMDLSRDQWDLLAARTSGVVPKGAYGLQHVLQQVRRFAHGVPSA